MKRHLITGLIAFIIGLALGAAITLFAYPFIFPPPEVNEQIADLEQKEKILSGSFIHPNPSDPIHWGRGGVSIYRGPAGEEVFLAEDFEVGPGPAFHVYLSSGDAITDNAAFEKAVNMDLGKLKSFRSNQVYAVPAHVQITEIQSVVIWCVAFGQLISSARLAAP